MQSTILEFNLNLNIHNGVKCKLEITKKMIISGQPPAGTVSGLRLREEPALINARGIILTPIRLFYDGIWGYERLANMLPEDYEVE